MEKQTPKTTTKKVAKPQGPSIKVNDTHVRAEVERPQFNRLTGKKLSKSSIMSFQYPNTWKQFQVHGPKQGLFVNRIVEAPEGADVSYVNPQ